MKKVLSITLFIFLLVAPAVAHDWYPPACCRGSDNGGDCRPVPCDELIENNDGSYTYHGTRFEKDAVQSSKDAKCHVCIGNSGYDNGRAYCAFTQQGS